MRTILALIAVLSFWSAAPGQLLPSPEAAVNSFSSDVTNADVIAIVSVGAADRVPFTNAAGAVTSLRSTEANVERAIKGNPPAAFQIREATHLGSVFPIETTVRTGSGTVHTGTSRWLVFLKKYADAYSAADAHGLYSVYGTGPGSRVIWRGSCLSTEEAETIINKSLAK